MSSSSSQGGKMTPELTALVHWTVGRCASATPLEAVALSGELITQIQQELTTAYRSGIAAVRRVTPNGTIPQNGGGNGAWSDQSLITSEQIERATYAEGAGV